MTLQMGQLRELTGEEKLNVVTAKMEMLIVYDAMRLIHGDSEYARKRALEYEVGSMRV